MAQLNYDDFVKMTEHQHSNSQSGNFNNKPFIGYFGLADDGDTALVRFNISNIDDVKVFSRHQVNAGGKRRNISCLITDPNQPKDVCPLCASGNKPSFRTLIQILRYETTDKGVECIPGIWEQPARIRETLKSFTMDYGDLRNYLFKIIRHGKRGDTGTTYTIIPANMNMYNSDAYKPDFDVFKDFNYGSFILEKTAEEMEVFLETGNFPNPFEKKDNEQNSTVRVESASVKEPSRTYDYKPQPEQTEVKVEKEENQSFKPRRYTY